MKKLLLITLFLLSLQIANSQLITDWQRNTNLAPFGEMNVQSDNNNNAVVVRGLASSGGFVQVGTCITKYDFEGNQLWSIEDNEFFDDFGFGMNDFDIDTDNNIVMGGIEMSPEDLYTHSMLIKLAPDGTELWRINLSPIMSWSESIENLVVAEDGSIFATAVLYLEDVTTLAQALVKISPDGIVEWTNFEDNTGFTGISMDESGMIYTTGYNNIRKYNQDGEIVWSLPISFTDGVYFSINAAPGGIRIVGDQIRIHTTIYDPNNNQNRIGLISGNTDGNNFTFSEHDILPEQDNEFADIVCFDVDETGNTYLVGRVSYGNSGPVLLSTGVERGGKGGTVYTAFLVYKISPNGDDGWIYAEYPIDENETVYPVESIIIENELIVVCSGGSVPTSSEYIYNFKTTNGAINWTQTIPNTTDFNSLFPQSAFLNTDGSLYISGNGSLAISDQLAYLNKYEFEEEAVNIENLDADNSGLLIYPNPVQNELNVRTTLGYEEIKIYDASGRLIISEVISGRSFISLPTNKLQAGYYLMTLTNDSGTINKFFVKS